MSHEVMVILRLVIVAGIVAAIFADLPRKSFRSFIAWYRRGCSGCIVESMGGHGFTPHTCLFGKTRRDSNGTIRLFQGPFRDRNFDAKAGR